MNKGITITEMVVVLIIIALIPMILIKGNDLIESSQIRRDITSISNVRTALTNYFADYQDFPENLTESHIINSGYINDEDLKLAFKAGDDANFMIRGFIKGELIIPQETRFDGKFIELNKCYGAGIVLDSAGYATRYLGCMIDAILDDGKSATGEIRQKDFTDTGKTNRVGPNECKKAVNDPSNRKNTQYAFLLH